MGCGKCGGSKTTVVKSGPKSIVKTIVHSSVIKLGIKK